MIRIRLDELLEERGLSGYALAKKSGVHPTVISKYRNNRMRAIQLGVLDQLCAGLKCQPGDLLVWEDRKTRKRAGRANALFDSSVSQSVSQKRKAAKVAATSLLF
jgi:putative transcriptional regulator